MKERVLKWLDISEMKILKHIIIISDRQYGETELGSIFYTRPFTEDYNLKKHQEEDAISNETTIDRLLQEHHALRSLLTSKHQLHNIFV